MVESVDFRKQTPATFPLDGKKLAEFLREVDPNRIWNYVDCMGKIIGDVAAIQNILSSFRDPTRSESLFNGLTEDQTSGLSGIIANFNEGDEESVLIDAVLKIKPVTEESLLKAMQLVDSLDGKDEVVEGMVEDLYQLSQHLKLLGQIFFTYKTKKYDDEWPTKLAQMSVSDLDHLITLVRMVTKTRLRLLVVPYYDKA